MGHAILHSHSRVCLNPPQVDNKDPWDPDPEVRGRIHSALAETHRVLSPSGCLLSITFAGPHFRRPLLRGTAGEFSWRVASDTFGEGEGWYYYLYTLRKGLRVAGDPQSDDEEARQARGRAAPSATPLWPRWRPCRAAAVCVAGSTMTIVARLAGPELFTGPCRRASRCRACFTRRWTRRSIS